MGAETSTKVKTDKENLKWGINFDDMRIRYVLSALAMSWLTAPFFFFMANWNVAIMTWAVISVAWVLVFCTWGLAQK